ncbi:MAG TPA: GNAT family N-acetyltransferase [Terriglobales bacterium]|nr:GNAT family N-acetyltransferase [Terriglobales bacterium]
MILETERLLLCEFVPEDADALGAVLSDSITMQYYPTPFTLEEVNDWIRRNRARYANDGFGLWAMLLKSTGELIGDCGFFVREVQQAFDFELGWHVRRDHWKQGYATEAAQRCIEHALGTLGADRIVALVRPENLSSCRVAEKSGMSRERVISWYEYDHCVYAKYRNLNNGR